MSKIDLSIITVTYNAEKFVEPTIVSIVKQTFDRFEYIIVDGESTDKTLAILDKYKNKIDLLISEPDHGIYDAMNKGLEQAKGTYILFINAGDELVNESTLSDIFQLNTGADLFYGETNILNQHRNVLGTRTELTSRKLPKQLNKKDFLQGQVVSHQSFIPKKSLTKPYNLDYKCSSDIDWMLHVISRAKNVVNVGFPISNYLQGGFSDNRLITCWKERFIILTRYFNLLSVLLAHLNFGIRFMKWGKYK